MDSCATPSQAGRHGGRHRQGEELMFQRDERACLCLCCAAEVNIDIKAPPAPIAAAAVGAQLCRGGVLNTVSITLRPNVTDVPHVCRQRKDRPMDMYWWHTQVTASGRKILFSVPASLRSRRMRAMIRCMHIHNVSSTRLAGMSYPQHMWGSSLINRIRQ